MLSLLHLALSNRTPSMMALLSYATYTTSSICSDDIQQQGYYRWSQTARQPTNAWDSLWFVRLTNHSRIQWSIHQQTSTINSTHALSTIQKVHKSSFPLKDTRSPTGSRAWIKPLQYALDLSTIFMNLGTLPTKRRYTLGYFKKTSLQGIFTSHI
jgi:hypothetical protein